MKTRYKIISKTRFYLFIITALIIIAICMIFLIDRGDVYSSYYYDKHQEIQVVKGDTLWDISRIYLSPGQDIRKLVYDIMELNEMNSGYIYPGDIIKIPIKD